jgi:hypothetical protein
MRPFLLCILALCLVSCGGPREDPLPRQAVLRWNEVVTVRVVKVWDVMQYHVDADPEVTHTMEVEVQDGPPRYAGKTLFLPYDQWAVGQPPPVKDAVETIMPSQWVTPSRESRGIPHPNWKR